MANCLVCGNSQFSPAMEVADFSNTGEKFDLLDCQNCGFRFTSNPPDEAECGRYYQNENYISHSNTRKGIIAKLYHTVRDIMLYRKYKLLTRYSNKKTLLDVGSGTGHFLNYLQRKGFNVKGVEMSDNARNFSIQNFSLDVKKTIDEIDSNSDYNFITLWHVLEHLYNPDRYMQIFRNLLSIDGTLIIALPNYSCYDSEKYKNHWAGYDVPRHLWHFKPKTFHDFAVKNGFKIISKHMMPFDPFYNALLSEKYKNSNLGILKGFLTGAVAYIKGVTSIDKASSIIYVLKSDSTD